MANQSLQEDPYNPWAHLMPAWNLFWGLFYWIFVYLSISIYYCGVLFNSAILVVFWKIGFTSNANISFFALAVADLYYSVVEALKGPLRLQSLYNGCSICGSIENWIAPMAVYSGMEAMCAWITTVITFERLCCIAFPLKVSSHKDSHYSKKIWMVYTRWNLTRLQGHSVIQIL